MMKLLTAILALVAHGTVMDGVPQINRCAPAGGGLVLERAKDSGKTWTTCCRACDLELEVERIAKTSSCEADKEGFAPPLCCKSLLRKHLASKSLQDKAFRQSSCSSSFPVVPDYGAAQPGQYRDNFFSRRDGSSPLPWGRKDLPFVPSQTNARSRTASKRRKGPRSRAEIDAERQALWDKTVRELDELAAHYHSLLPMEQAKSIAALYARYSTRFQDSIVDQVRAIFEDAIKKGIFIPREFIFFDLAVRGCKNKRQGLDQLRAVLQNKAVPTVFFFATNRLFRKLYRSLEFVDQVHKELGIRCIFAKSGVDTDDKKRWEMLLYCHGMMDQFVVSMYGDHVRAAHEGLFDKGLVFGTISFGYTGKPIEGQFTKRKKPRRLLVIDPETSKWVITIFTWYLQERVAIDEIVRRLNDDPEIPLPPKCLSEAWNHDSVVGVLANPRYRGWWQYGATEAVWISSKDYVRQVTRQEPLKECQIEELRLVSDEMWFAAQRRLKEEGLKRGRKSKDGNRKSRPKLLNGLFWCPEHDRPLYVGGARGHSMFCAGCKGLMAEKRPLYSLLNRKLALKLTCEALSRLIKVDEDLVSLVIGACQNVANSFQEPDSSRLSELQQKVRKHDAAIDFNLRNPGATPDEQEETSKVLKRLRNERSELHAEIRSLEAAAQREIELPTEDDVHMLLKSLDEILAQAALGEGDGDFGKAREIITMLTGGHIELHQQGDRSPQQGWLQGRFRTSLLDVIVSMLMGVRSLGNGSEIEVAIDYREASDAERLADRVMELYEGGKLIKAIAKELEIDRNLAHKALEIWHLRRGLEPPQDGRSRRSQLKIKHLEAPPYQAIADEVKRRMDKGELLQDIATAMNVDRNTVTAAKKFWYESHGLQPPDGRTRRKELKLPPGA